MKVKLFLTSLLLGVTTLTLSAQETVGVLSANPFFRQLGEETYVSGMSPTGNYVIGYKLTEKAEELYSTSFLYSASSQKLEWRSSLDLSDLSKAAMYVAVNDEGVICGAVKDLDNEVQWDGIKAPTNVAAVWKEGKLTKLPYGSLNKSEFKQHGDGTFAKAISADGKVVIGYATGGNFAKVRPLKWTQGDTGEWTVEVLPLPEGATNASAYDMSADGKVILGTCQIDYNNQIVYWRDGVAHTVSLQGADVKEGRYGIKGMDLSAGGKFFTFMLSYTTQYRLFDVEAGSYTKIPTFDAHGIGDLMFAADNGNVTGSFTYGGIATGELPYKRPFYYEKESNRIFDLSYYISLYGEGVSSPFDISVTARHLAYPSGISSDGRTIIGNKDTNVQIDQVPNGWMLQLSDGKYTIPEAPRGLTATSKALKEVTLSWDVDRSTYPGLTLVGYQLYSGATPLARIDKIEGERLEYTVQNVAPGFPEFRVEALFKKSDGKEMVSPRSDAVAVAVAENYDLPFFDNFDSGSLKTNYWTTNSKNNDPNALSFWDISPQMGYRGSVSLVGSNAGKAPYSSSITTRPMDARQATNISLHFYMLSVIYQDFEQELVLDKDSLAIEYSTDMGETWQVAKSWTVGQLPKTAQVMSEDLTSFVKGKVFLLRLHVYGKGKANYTLYTDNFKLSTTPEKPAPEGLIGYYSKESKSLSLAWQAPDKCYTLNFISGEPDEFLTLGDKGNPLIGANKFTSEELKLFDGKYLTAVTSEINLYGDPETANMKVEVIIYEDGKLVRQQPFEFTKYVAEFTQPLAEPLLIDSKKELIVGLRVSDYAEDEMPLMYAKDEHCIPGKSDLYSTDEGKTWKSVHETFTEEDAPDQAPCSWLITARISTTDRYDAEETTDAIIGTNVYCEKEQLNTKIIPDYCNRFVDKAPQPNTSYEVQAFYEDGGLSTFSLPYNCNELSVDEVVSRTASKIHFDGRLLSVDLPATSLTLFAIDGRKVAEAQGNVLELAEGFVAGSYILYVEYEGGASQHRVFLR